MSDITAAQLYLNGSALPDADPFTNAALTNAVGGIKLASGIFKISNAALYTGVIYVSAPHNLPTVSALARVAYPSDAQAVILVNPTTGNGYAVKGTGQLRLYPFTNWDTEASPLTFGTTTLADNDYYEISYDGSNIRAYKNNVLDFTYAATDTGLKVGYYYNIDNVQAGGAKALGFNYSNPVSIDSITTAGNNGFVVGEYFNINTTGLTGPLTSVTGSTVGLAGATFTAADLSAASGDGIGQCPYWVDGEKYPKIGTIRGQANNSTTNATLDVPLNLPANYVAQTFSAVIYPDDTWLGYPLNAMGRPLANNDRAYWPFVNNLSFATNSKISVNLPPGGSMTTDLWIQKVDGTMQYYFVTINDTGGVSIVPKRSRPWIGVGVGI